MKRGCRFLVIISVGFLIFALLIVISIVIINKPTSTDPEQLTANLPKRIIPKYPTENQWWKETNVYQIYPRSFKDSNGDGVGDIAGIISQLDYIDSMGFETIWISPFFKSPLKDHGYDVSDYRGIAEEYGTMDDVDRLIYEVHKRGLKIVFDMVLNHTSDQHSWFLESKISRDNPKADWYVWRDGKGENPPNNWQNIIAQGSAWTYDSVRDQWYYAAFLPFQPDLNMSNPEVQDEIFDMIRFWLDKDVDGFRLDIFNFIFENTEYPDNPSSLRMLPDFENAVWMFEKHKYNFHQPEVVQFAKNLRGILEEYPEGRFMVGEVFGSHQQMRELLGMVEQDGLNLVFLFDFIHAFEFSASFFREKAELYEAIYPKPLVPTYVFGNHDQFRIMSRLDNDSRKAEVLAAYQLTMRGVPFIYNGEEIGMYSSKIPIDEAQDPLAKGWQDLPLWLLEKADVFTNRDNCRTPMQWNSTTNAGFSTSENTWLPVQENYKKINVARQLDDPNSLLITYKNLLSLRKQNPVLRKGDLNFLDDLPEGILGYIRFINNQKVIVLLNFTNQSCEVNAMPGKILINKRTTVAREKTVLGNYGILILSSGD